MGDQADPRPPQDRPHLQQPANSRVAQDREIHLDKLDHAARGHPDGEHPSGLRNPSGVVPQRPQVGLRATPANPSPTPGCVTRRQAVTAVRRTAMSELRTDIEIGDATNYELRTFVVKDGRLVSIVADRAASGRRASARRSASPIRRRRRPRGARRRLHLRRVLLLDRRGPGSPRTADTPRGQPDRGGGPAVRPAQSTATTGRGPRRRGSSPTGARRTSPSSPGRAQPARRRHSGTSTAT